jgi:hypothetical protein
MEIHSYLLTGTFPWGGMRYAGRHFTSPNLLKMIKEWGEHFIIDACQTLDVLPYDDELEIINEYLIENEVKY